MIARSELEAWLIRHRAWVVMGVLVGALVVVGVTGVGSTGNRSASSSARPRVVFGSTVREGPSALVLTYTNGWVATSGTTTVAVYAGSQTLNRGNGLLVVSRSIQGRQIRRSLVLRGAGAVTLLRPPSVQTEAQALQETLRFVTASGDTGSLDLDGDRISTDG